MKNTMEKEKIFEKNWKEAVRYGLNGRPIERVDSYDLARMFFEIGFSNGVMKC